MGWSGLGVGGSTADLVFYRSGFQPPPLFHKGFAGMTEGGCGLIFVCLGWRFNFCVSWLRVGGFAMGFLLFCSWIPA